MGATMATRTSQGSMTTSTFLRFAKSTAATRGVRLGGARYMIAGIKSQAAGAGDAAERGS